MQLADKAGGGMRPKREDEAVLVLVPTPAISTPNGIFQGFLNGIVVGSLGLRPDQDAGFSLCNGVLQQAADVVCLGFEHDDGAAVAQVAVGPVHHEEIGKTRDGYRAMRTNFFGPRLRHRQAFGPRDRHVAVKFRRLKTRCQNHQVRFQFKSAFGHQAGISEEPDAIAHQAHVGLLQGRKEIIAEQDALAADVIIRRQASDHIRVFHMPLKVLANHPVDVFFGKTGLAHKVPMKQEVTEPIQPPPGQALHKGQFSENRLFNPCDPPVFAWREVIRGPLDDADMACRPGQLRNDLNGAGSTAHDDDFFTGIIVVPVPFSGVHQLAFILVKVFEGRFVRNVQDTDGADHVADPQLLVPNTDERPATVRVAGLSDFETMPRPLPELILVHHFLLVVMDFPGTGESMAPVGVHFKAEAVELAGYITAGSRILVVTPGASDFIRFFQHDEILDTITVQGDRDTHAAKTRANDGYLVIKPPVVRSTHASTLKGKWSRSKGTKSGVRQWEFVQ